MSLAVCARDVKFYEWPNIYFTGSYELPAECMSVKCISWCCEGNNVLVVKSKGEPLLINAPRGNTRVSTIKCLPFSNVFAGVYSKSSPGLLALGLENGEVNIYNLENKDLIRYKKLPSGIQNLDISFDDQNILAGCFDGNIFLYDDKGRPVASFMVPNCYSLSTTLFSNYSKLLAGASKDGSFAVWNSETTDLELCCKEHTSRITDLAFQENTITSVGTDGILCIFDLRTHKLVSKNNLDGALSSLAYFSNCYDLAVSTYNQLRSYDSRNLKSPVRTLLINNGAHIKNIKASPSGPINLQAPKEQGKPHLEVNLSASGDFSINSKIPSEYLIRDFISSNLNTNHVDNTKNKTFKRSEVNELEKFVNDYLKYSSLQFAERMAQSFYALRINTSKQFICMGEKMEESWNHFISYLRHAGNSESASSLESRSTLTKNVGKQ